VDSNEREAFERDWAALSEEVLSGMADWRAQHPRATLSEIEAELDARLARMRACLLEVMAGVVDMNTKHCRNGSAIAKRVSKSNTASSPSTIATNTPDSLDSLARISCSNQYS